MCYTVAYAGKNYIGLPHCLLFRASKVLPAGSFCLANSKNVGFPRMAQCEYRAPIANAWRQVIEGKYDGLGKVLLVFDARMVLLNLNQS